METKFQTSFIPKKPLTTGSMAGVNLGISTPKPVRTRSLFLDLSILIFIVSLCAAGGVYAWKTVAVSNQNYYKQQLSEREKQFDPSLIKHLKQVSDKINNAKTLLSRHLALSGVFEVISKMTIEDVRFMSMEVRTASNGSTPQSTNNFNTGLPIKISLSGYGTSLPAVAFQAKVLSELEKYNLRNIVKNPVVSEPSLENSSSISFGITAELDPESVIYMNELSNTTASSTSSQ